VDTRFRREGGLAPEGQPLLATRPTSTIHHLLKQAIEARGPALRGVGTAQTAESVAVVEPPECELSWHTTIPRGVVGEVRDLHHRKHAPVVLLEGEVEPALPATGGPLVGVEHPD